MRASLVRAPGRIECVEIAQPKAAPDQVVVRNLAASICGSDLHEVFMPLRGNTFPCQHGFPGHEAVGEIVDGGNTGLRSGQRVLTAPDRLCSSCFADYQAISTKFVLPVPADIPAERMTLAQPLGTVIFALKSYMPGPPPDTAVVLGQGAIGLFFTAVLKRNGVSRVIATDPEANRRTLSGTFGADIVLDPDEVSVPAAVADLTGGQGAPLVIEAAGTDTTRIAAIGAVARDGTIGNFGLPEGDTIADFPFAELFSKRAQSRSVFGSQFEPNLASYRQAVDLIARGAIDVGPLISRRYGIGEIDKAFAAAHARQDGVVKAIVTFD